MAHIFFEKLENRRSTQSLYGWSSPTGVLGDYYTAPVSSSLSSSVYKPSPVTASISLGGWGYGNGYNSLWNNPISTSASTFTSPSTSPSTSSSSSWANPSSNSSWTNPSSNLWSSVNNFLSPVWNTVGGFFGLQPSGGSVYPSWPGGWPGGASPKPVNPPMQVMPLYGVQVSQPVAYYGISLPSSTTSYVPPGSNVGMLYGVSPRPNVNMLYGVSPRPNVSALYGISPGPTMSLLYGVSATQPSASFSSWPSSFTGSLIY